MKTCLLKKLTLTILSCFALLQMAKSQLVVGNVGTNEFLVDPAFTTVNYTQSSTNTQIFPNVAFSDIISGVWTTSKDWSSYSLSDFGLIFSIEGTNPDIGFSIDLYNSSFDIANTFEGYTTGVGNTPTFVALTLLAPGTGDMSDIKAAAITWNLGGDIDMNWQSVAVVPEPSTLLLLSVAGIGLTALYLRKKYKSIN